MPSRLILLINETNDDGLEDIITTCLNHVAGWNVISISSRYKSLSPLLKKQPDAILVNALLSNIDGLSFDQVSDRGSLPVLDGGVQSIGVRRDPRCKWVVFLRSRN